MDERIRNGARPHDGRAGSLGELIHAAVRRAIEVAVDEELTAALARGPTSAAVAGVATATGPSLAR
jgi:hypothetical protein